MRLDPKHFNLFLGICAAITAIAIFLFTVLYVSNQQETFREEIGNIELSEWKMFHFASGDSISTDQFKGSPVIIHFWSTWSDMSMKINEELHQLEQNTDDIVVIAAAARDGDKLVKEYMNSVPYNFVFVNGTKLYQSLMVPGLPSQLYVNRDGDIVDHLVGDDPGKREQKIQSLLGRY
ncbi:hypothetical protein BH23BAC3_BH23BAC3_03360 [soil metagenome]